MSGFGGEGASGIASSGGLRGQRPRANRSCMLYICFKCCELLSCLDAVDAATLAIVQGTNTGGFDPYASGVSVTLRPRQCAQVVSIVSTIVGAWRMPRKFPSYALVFLPTTWLRKAKPSIRSHGIHFACLSSCVSTIGCSFMLVHVHGLQGDGSGYQRNGRGTFRERSHLQRAASTQHNASTVQELHARGG